MLSTVQQNPLNTSFNQYWTNYGIPFMIPSAGSGGLWDGSRWIEKEESVTPLYQLDPNDGGGNSGTDPGTQGFGNSSGSFGIGGVASQGAAEGFQGAVGSALGNAAFSGTLAGALAGDFGVGLSSAVAGLANPGTMAGIVGATVNGALGFSPSLGMSALAGLASLASPALGMAIGVFGPPIADVAMDAFDAREYEHTRDYVEDLAGSFFSGRTAANHVANAINNEYGINVSDKANAIANALGELGFSPSTSLLADVVGSYYADMGYDADVANALGYGAAVSYGINNAIGQGFGVGFGSQQAGPTSFNNPTGSFSIGPAMNAALANTYADLSTPTSPNTQTPSPASEAIGKGVDDNTSGKGPSSTPGSPNATNQNEAEQGTTGTPGNTNNNNDNQGDQGNTEGGNSAGPGNNSDNSSSNNGSEGQGSNSSASNSSSSNDSNGDDN